MKGEDGQAIEVKDFEQPATGGLGIKVVDGAIAGCGRGFCLVVHLR